MSDRRLARTDSALSRWSAPEWHKLWLMLRARPWLTLAVVPSDNGISVELTLSVAVLLSRAGAAHLHSPIHVADATTIKLATLGTLTGELELCRQSGAPVLIALPSVVDNPAALSITHHADAALLCAVRAKSRLPDIKAVISDVRANRFVGSVIFDGSGPA